jgi:hypothetical protein
MNPEVWGPHAWIFLHSITLAYPDCPTTKDKQVAKTFFGGLQDVLPCGNCQTNYKKNLKKYPLTDKTLSSKKELVKWLIDIHNLVNLETGSPVRDYMDVLNDYRKLYDRGFNYGRITVWLVVIAVILIVAFICYKRLSKPF